MERQPGKIDEVFTHFREEEKAADEEKRDSVDIEISTKHITQMPLVLADFLKLYQGLLHWLEQTSYKARRTSEVIHTKLYDVYLFVPFVPFVYLALSVDLHTGTGTSTGSLARRTQCSCRMIQPSGDNATAAAPLQSRLMRG